MFRVIGGAVVYGLALYGAVKLFDRPKMKLVSQPSGKQNDQKRSRAAHVGDMSGTPTPDQTSEASTQSASTRSV